MFETETIRALLRGVARDRLEALDVLTDIDSTNTCLLDAEPPKPLQCRVALTDHQTAGRGRQGRRWLSRPGSSICLSIAYTFNGRPPELPAATLPVGVAVVRALEDAGIPGARLKWPNDIVIQNGKLGGILTEVHTGARDKTSIVVGIGLNVDVGDATLLDPAETGIGAVRDIASVVSGAPPDANVIVAALIERVLDSLVRFEADGLEPFIEAWQRLDWLRGQRVTIEAGPRRIDGVCEGIDVDGALILSDGSSRQRILSGSVHPIGPTGGPA
jgi:BirA family biotin operon repressor/biotin-[acetyl-CoA-carboxylase] ligase